ncbi:polysaccharide pyruvyl transferase family protein [Streptomyces sp. MK7]|uniref:polysaccharide pyruvyl transferase family protein n=1 Tax=Streptomyces sp. MK7 TaxID=3067635 RepID=UPI002931C6A5|nr:polysaccharide pyruvyl transferase family protein [Streptomyces sp. MK7]
MTTSPHRTPRSRAPRIGLLGSYGGYNIGDEAVLQCVLGCLRGHRPRAHLVVFSRDAEHTRAHQSMADEVVPWEGVPQRQVTDVLSGLDLLVLGGGGILYDGEARRYLKLVRAAQLRGVRTFAYAVGAGPLHEGDDREAVRTVLAAMDEVVVRDQESRLVLEEVGVERDLVVTADPALLLPPEPFTAEMMRQEGVPADARLVGMSVREPGRAAEKLDEGDYHALLADVADFLVRRLDAHVVFMPMERHDVRHAHAVLSRMTAPDRGRILHSAYTPGQVLGLMSHLDLVVGMRLHFLIFAAVSGLPVLPLPYAGKVFDFARRLGAPALVGVAREQVGLLLAEVDRLWDEFPQRRVDLGARVRALRELAGETCARCGTLLDAMDREDDDRVLVDTPDIPGGAPDRPADASVRSAGAGPGRPDGAGSPADPAEPGSSTTRLGSPADPVGADSAPVGDTPVSAPHGLHLLRPAHGPGPGSGPGPGTGPGAAPDPEPGAGVVPDPGDGAVRSGGAGQEA